MGKLILKQFHCRRETSGGGADSPYFLVFVGGLQPRKAKVKRIRLGNWHDEVDSGELWPVNQTVADQDLALVLCAVIEEDGDGADILEVFLQQHMEHHFNNLTANQTTVSSYIGGELRKKFRDKIQGLFVNDDMIQVRRIGVSNGPGELTLPFVGDGAEYRVTFAVQ